MLETMRVLLGTLMFKTNAGVERMRIDSSGNILIGTAVATSFGAEAWTSNLLLQGTQGAAIYRSSADIYGGVLVLAKSRSGAIVSSGDRIGEIVFAPHDGVDLTNSAAIIRAEVDTTPGSNDIPGRLLFMTSPDGSNNPVERMRINNAGNINMNYQLSVLGGIYSPWTTSKTYVVGALALSGNYVIMCMTAHTSGTYATDVQSGYWQMATSMNNYVLNGGFDLWQRGPDWTITGITRTYKGADRWHTWGVTSGSIHITQISAGASMPGSRYMLRGARTTGNAQAGIHWVHVHEVDRDSVIQLRGKTCSLSFWIRGGTQGSGTPNITFDTGTGAETQVRNTGYTGEVSQINHTPSLSANVLTKMQYTFTMPALATTAAIAVNYTPTGTGNEAAEYIDLAQVMLNEGPAPAVFQTAGANIAHELTMAQRYFEIIQFGRLFGFKVTATIFAVIYPFYVQKYKVPVIFNAADLATTFGSGAKQIQPYDTLNTALTQTGGITCSIGASTLKTAHINVAAGSTLSGTLGAMLYIAGGTTEPAVGLEAEI
jgi:hypothetical protein